MTFATFVDANSNTDSNTDFKTYSEVETNLLYTQQEISMVG